MSSNQVPAAANSTQQNPASVQSQQSSQQQISNTTTPIPTTQQKAKTPQKPQKKSSGQKKVTPKSKSQKNGTPKTPRSASTPSLETDAKGIPIDYKDPISQLIMSDPVSTAAGSTYERESIERWLDSSDTDPITGIKLKTKLVFPNNALKNQITLFLERKPHLKEYVCAQGEYTLERIENLLKEENMIHEVTKLIRKASNLYKKESKQNILHIVLSNAHSLEYVTKVFEQQVIAQQMTKLLSQRDINGHTPLTLAFQNGSFDVFKYVVTNHLEELLKETQVNRVDAYPEEARYHISEHLMDSCSDGFLDGVRVLTHFGVDLHEKVDNVDFYPIEEAAYYGHTAIVTFICKTGNVSQHEINRALGSAADGHHIDCLQVCLDEGAEIDSTPDILPCPLTRAVGNLSTVKFLVEHGAQINVTHPTMNEEPSNPLSAAAQMPNPKHDEEYLRVMDYLLEKGANIDYQDDRGWAAIHYAVRSLNKKSIGKLIENECNVDLQTNDKKTVYDIADEYEDTESLGEEDSSVDEDMMPDGGPMVDPMDGGDDIIVEDLEDEEGHVHLTPSGSGGGRHSTHSNHSRSGGDRAHEEHYYFVDDGADDEMFFEDGDDSEGMSSAFSENAQSIKEFIKEHSKLVKRLRQSMLKKDITVLSTEMSALKKQHENVFEILKQQGELLKQLLNQQSAANNDSLEPISPGVGAHSDVENATSSAMKKRKRKKSVSGGSQKKKKQRTGDHQQ